MLYQYALTPDVFEHHVVNEMRPPGVVLLQLLREFSENGLLANLDAGRWITSVFSLIDDRQMPPDVRKQIQLCLNRLSDRNRLIQHPPGSPEHAGDDFRWLRWSLERHQRDTLSGIFTSDDYYELSEIQNEVLTPLAKLQEFTGWVNRERSLKFKRTESNLRTILSPILRYAQRIYLIDPYLTCREDQFLRTVQQCAELVGHFPGKRRAGEIHIHAAHPQFIGTKDFREPVPARLTAWAGQLNPLAKRWGHKFKVTLWGRKKGAEGWEEKMHDRYLITDQCGVLVAGGLDQWLDTEEAAASATTWSLLDKKTADEIVQIDFHPGKSQYQYLDSRQIGPTH